MSQKVGRDGAIRLKREFRDRHELRAYGRAVLLAKRLLDNPELIARGRAYLERFVSNDPGQRRIYQLWNEALQSPVADLAADLLS